ncbi:MAG: hypothetical protein HY921_12305 [Elusimicrobia bacterium]|nr:hypothetical protein [Elusimicrobiota bacterium]
MPNKALLALLLLPEAALGLGPQAAERIETGLKNLYDLNYEQSRASFREIIALEPDNPFGYLAESGALWWQSFQEYGLFKDTPTLEGLFEADVEAALAKAEPLTDSEDKSVKADAHFVMGMALGTRGQWHMMRGQWLKAYFDGKKALKHLKKCLKSDPEYYDAYLGLGVYDYQVDHFRGLLKLGFLFGVRGDEDRGLERMRLAMDRGRYGSRQAAQFLCSIYITDRGDYAQALQITRKLLESFPDSLYFQFLEAMLLYKTGDLEGSLQAGGAILKKAQADPRQFNRKLLSLACGMTGDRCLSPEVLRDSVNWFDQALAIKRGDAWLALNHLYRGYAHAGLGQDQEARRDFLWVLTHPDFSDAHSRAKECLKKNCDAAEVLSYLRALSRS